MPARHAHHPAKSFSQSPGRPISGLGANGAAPAEHRAGVLSALFLIAYLLMGVVALGLGAVATYWQLDVAVDLGAAVIFVMSLATMAKKFCFFFKRGAS